MRRFLSRRANRLQGVVEVKALARERCPSPHRGPLEKLTQQEPVPRESLHGLDHQALEVLAC